MISTDTVTGAEILIYPDPKLGLNGHKGRVVHRSDFRICHYSESTAPGLLTAHP